MIYISERRKQYKKKKKKKKSKLSWKFYATNTHITHAKLTHKLLIPSCCWSGCMGTFSGPVRYDSQKGRVSKNRISLSCKCEKICCICASRLCAPRSSVSGCVRRKKKKKIRKHATIKTITHTLATFARTRKHTHTFVQVRVLVQITLIGEFHSNANVHTNRRHAHAQPH